MSLRDQIKQKSAGLVRREPIRLPESGIDVQVRGLMSGDVRRCGESKRQAETQAALSVEDPETGDLIWNPNSREDLDEIAGLHAVDLAVIIEASNRLSGLGKLEAIYSAKVSGSSSPSLPDSDAPSQS